jgi:DNA replicative helicase MCM subunit Mcm2 (Cdc46/Mcm family)
VCINQVVGIVKLKPVAAAVQYSLFGIGSYLIRSVARVFFVQTGGSRTSFNSSSTESAVHHIYVDALSVTKYDDGQSSDKDCGKGGTAASAESGGFSAAELQSFSRIAATEGCIGLLAASLCPQIFGHDLKKLGLLMGLGMVSQCILNWICLC